MTLDPRIDLTLRRVVELLVREDYSSLERWSNGTRLRASEMQSGIESYGKTLIFPPDDAYSRVDVVPIRGTHPPSFSIRFRLHTKEEGESDLEVQATFIGGQGSDIMGVEIDNIIVA